MRENPLQREPLKVYKGGGFSERVSKLKPHQVGMQVSCSMDTKMQKEGALRTTQETVGNSPQRTGPAEGM